MDVISDAIDPCRIERIQYYHWRYRFAHIVLWPLLISPSPSKLYRIWQLNGTAPAEDHRTREKTRRTKENLVMEAEYLRLVILALFSSIFLEGVNAYRMGH